MVPIKNMYKISKNLQKLAFFNEHGHHFIDLEKRLSISIIIIVLFQSLVTDVKM